MTQNSDQSTNTTESSATLSATPPMEMKNPILKEISMDGRIGVLQFIDGLEYKLQHPGNRKAEEWKSLSLTDKVNSEELMDNFFAYCVIPMGNHARPVFDHLHPRHLEVWKRIAYRFLNGKLEPGLQ